MTRIAAAQFASTDDKESNFETFRNIAEVAHEEGADIVCFPELANSTYFCNTPAIQNFSLAEKIPGPTTDRLCQIAKEYEIAIVCGMFEKVREGECYNSAAVVTKTGNLLGQYRKMSIPLSATNDGVHGYEKLYFRPGNLGFRVFDVDGLRVGVLICYDRHFPEAARVLALHGADVIFVPTATNRRAMRDAWEIELRAHAIANGLYVCGVNKAGDETSGNSYFGCSIVIGPNGSVLARANESSTDVITAEVDHELLREHRRRWPLFRDRRPDAYKVLTETTI